MNRQRVVALAALLLGTAACTDYEVVRPGMAEHQVVAAIGVPDERLTEGSDLWLYKQKSPCAAEVTSALLYERFLRDDFVVGLRKDSRVTCTWYSSVMTSTFQTVE